MAQPQSTREEQFGLQARPSVPPFSAELGEARSVGQRIQGVGEVCKLACDKPGLTCAHWAGRVNTVAGVGLGGLSGGHQQVCTGSKQ
jgi:hypothetical protein